MPSSRWYRNNRPSCMCRTDDRIGDYLVALYYDFIVEHRDCSRGLNIRGDLNAYEREKRVLVKLATTGSAVSILLRFGRMLESYLQVLQIPKSEQVQQWKSQLEQERQDRVELFQRLLLDEQGLIQAMGDESQQMEILTLLKRDIERYGGEVLTPQELDVMSEVYDRVVSHSGTAVVGSTPSWFLSPSELLSLQGGCFLDDVRVNKCTIGGSPDNQKGGEDREEMCLREASTWTDLNHPHVAKLLGGCYIGKKPFLVHEPAEPLVKNRSNVHSWKPILGWALGLQYLHERELGYKSFENERLLVHHTVTSSGVLSGLGLVPLQRQSKVPLDRKYTKVFSLAELKDSLPGTDDEISDLQKPWTVPDEVCAFGMAIFNIRRRAAMYGNDVVRILPRECPAFLAEREWDLIQKMCARLPRERVNMWYVVHQLQAFVSAEPSADNSKAPVDLSVSAGPADDEEPYTVPDKIDDFIVAKMHAKVADALPRLELLFKDLPETSEMLEHVLNRLQRVRNELQEPDEINDAISVKQGFVDLLNRFYLLLQSYLGEKQQPSSSEIAIFCEARAAAQSVTSFHHEIDRLLTLAGLRDTPSSAREPPAPLSLSSSRGDSSDSITAPLDIHHWKDAWNKVRRQQLRDFQACLEDTASLKEMLKESQAREEAQMLLQFESQKRRGSYPDSVLHAMTEALKVLEELDGEASETVPIWFIPPYEVQLGERIGGGGFADVYYGKWFDTDVVVKILKSQAPPSINSTSAPLSNGKVKSNDAPKSASKSKPKEEEEDPMDVFRREADHWFMLSHQNVVHLYGACHVGRPFFVCEPAKKKSLVAHLESLARLNSSSTPSQQAGGNASDIMRSLYLAGVGLKYLHDRGIIHSDLKANNFMVGTDGKNIKLGDFGLSVVQRPGAEKAKEYAAPGAFRWKAPEILLGGGPTKESDVFGFGMSILELLSGSFPWGNQLPEAAVKFYVTKRKQLPPKPKNITDFQWRLVTQMCCFEPSERISLAAALDMLTTFRFNEPRLGVAQ